MGTIDPVGKDSRRNNIRRIVGTDTVDALGLWTFDKAPAGLSPVLSFESVLVDVSVSPAQNWQILTVSSSEEPPTTAALGGITEGATAVLATTFDAHSLEVVAGYNNLEPQNLCMVTDIVGNAIYSGVRRVWALLQTEDGTDGHTFDDTSLRVQLSFVRVNATFTDIEAVPVADIESKVVRYHYSRRQRLDNIEQGHARQQSPAQNDNVTDVAFDHSFGGGSVDNVSTSSTSYARLATFVYLGTDAMKALKVIHANVWLSSAGGGKSGALRIVEGGGGAVVAELTGIVSAVKLNLQVMGAVSNVPTAATVFEVQGLRAGGTSLELGALTGQY